MSHNHTWEEAQKEELDFWNAPGSELGEQLKQLAYAKYLGLEFMHDGNSPYVIEKAGKKILDVGGGPVSLLLKTTANPNDYRLIADPCHYPEFVRSRYADSGIDYWITPGELLHGDIESFDEVWMYNVLQHTTNPQKIFNNIYDALNDGGQFRFLDWVNTPTNVAHPITMSVEDVRRMVVKAGFSDEVYTTFMNENGAVGDIAYGIFTK